MANEFSIAVLFKLIDELTKPMQKMGLAIQNQGKRIEEAGTKFTAFGKKASLFVTAPIVALGAAIVQNTADMEDYQASFETMLGSVDKAKTLLGNLQKFAAATPFEFKDLAEGSKLLLNYGIAGENIMPTISMLGDVAQGNAEKLRLISLAYGQITSTGRLMGQDLLQLINAGFNPLQIISKKTGESMAVLKDRMAKGGVSAEEVADAFKIATSEGGMFYKGMERASKTFHGLWSTLMDDLATFGRQFGEVIIPVAKDILKWLSGLLQGFGKLDDSTKTFIIGLALAAAAIGPLSMGVGGLIKGVGGLVSAFGFLMAHPVILGLVAIGAAIGGIVVAVNAWNSRFDDAIKNTDKLTASGNKLISEYQELQGKANKNNVEMARMREIQAQLIQINPEFKNSINSITGELELGTDAAQRFNKAMAAQQWKNVVQNINDVDKKIAEFDKKIAAESGFMGSEWAKKEYEKMKEEQVLKKLGLLVDKEKLEATLNGTDAKKAETKATKEFNDAIKTTNNELSKELNLKNYMMKMGELAVDKSIKANVSGMMKKSGAVDVTVKVSSDRGSSALIDKVSKSGDVKVNVISDSYLGLAGI